MPSKMKVKNCISSLQRCFFFSCDDTLNDSWYQFRMGNLAPFFCLFYGLFISMTLTWRIDLRLIVSMHEDQTWACGLGEIPSFNTCSMMHIYSENTGRNGTFNLSLWLRPWKPKYLLRIWLISDDSLQGFFSLIFGQGNLKKTRDRTTLKLLGKNSWKSMHFAVLKNVPKIFWCHLRNDSRNRPAFKLFVSYKPIVEELEMHCATNQTLDRHP